MHIDYDDFMNLVSKEYGYHHIAWAVMETNRYCILHHIVLIPELYVVHHCHWCNKRLHPRAKLGMDMTLDLAEVKDLAIGQPEYLAPEAERKASYRDIFNVHKTCISSYNDDDSCKALNMFWLPVIRHAHNTW